MEKFNAVIQKHHPYYVNGNCNSIDGVYGFNENKELCRCRECPSNVFGSAENGKKECKQGRKIYLQKEGESENTEIAIYDMNCVAFSKYVMKLLSKGLRSSKVITTFEKTETDKGIQWQFSMLKELEQAIADNGGNEMKQLKPLEMPKWEEIKNLLFAKIGIGQCYLEVANGKGGWAQRLRARIYGKWWRYDFNEKNYIELCKKIESYRQQIYETMEEL